MHRFALPFISAVLLSVPAWAQSPDRHPLYEPVLSAAVASGDEGNLFAGEGVTASGHYGKDLPELAVDGKTDGGDKFWGCENLPVWLQIDMGQPRVLSSLHVWPYWKSGRIYQYRIEGSRDGKKWEMLADQSSNSIVGTQDGVPLKFNPKTVRYVKITFTGSNAGKEAGGHLVEIKAYGPNAGVNLNASAVRNYDRISASGAPQAGQLQDKVSLYGWRGERASGQVAVWSVQAQPQLTVSCAGVRNASGKIIPVQVRTARTV